VFQDRSPNFKTGIGKITMYAYNLSADSLLWKTPLNQRNSNVALPLIEGDRVYFQASDRVYCFDLLTGKVRWSQDFGGGKGFLTTNLLIIDDKLICGPHDIELIAVNKLTGQPIWWNYSSGGSRNYMVHHKGRIYFTAMGSAKLHCVDAQTGKSIFAERPPTAIDDDRASYFGSEIVIDPKTGLLYTHDRFHALCLKLPD
jgi:outer membrane protein assembly factor BamB